MKKYRNIYDEVDDIEYENDDDKYLDKCMDDLDMFCTHVQKYLIIEGIRYKAQKRALKVVADLKKKIADRDYEDVVKTSRYAELRDRGALF